MGKTIREMSGNLQIYQKNHPNEWEVFRGEQIYGELYLWGCCKEELHDGRNFLTCTRRLPCGKKRLRKTGNSIVPAAWSSFIRHIDGWWKKFPHMHTEAAMWEEKIEKDGEFHSLCRMVIFHLAKWWMMEEISSHAHGGCHEGRRDWERQGIP